MRNNERKKKIRPVSWLLLSLLIRLVYIYISILESVCAFGRVTFAPSITGLVTHPGAMYQGSPICQRVGMGACNGAARAPDD